MHISFGYLQVCCSWVQLDARSRTWDMPLHAHPRPTKPVQTVSPCGNIWPLSVPLHTLTDHPSPFCTPLQSLCSLPCHLGGEAVEAVSTAASKAAEEAATGSWLKQLESGSLPRITAPGLSQGWFGPWETEEEALEHDDAAGRYPFVFQPSLEFKAGSA